jgi:hypothetical protein
LTPLNDLTVIVPHAIPYGLNCVAGVGVGLSVVVVFLQSQSNHCFVAVQTSIAQGSLTQT